MANSYLYHKRKGRVLIIAPFNYPINLLFFPLIGAISGSNQVLLKSAPTTPNTNVVIKKIIEKTFDEELVSYIDEKDIKTYDDLYEYKPNLIFFTGSTKVGKIIETNCIRRGI